MEKMNLLVNSSNGVMRLPPGFRFHPTDQELLLHYLKHKLFLSSSSSSPLPCSSIIPDFDHLSNSDPWDLPGDKGQERYFFCKREAKYPNGNRSNRATLSGYWKSTGKDKPILAGTLPVGFKKTLVFYRGKPPTSSSRTPWIMHEYRLLHPHTPTSQKTGDWVLCRIFLKKRNNAPNKNNSSTKDGEKIVCGIENTATGIGKPVFYDFMPTDLNLPTTPCSSSSGSSAVTDLSSHDDNDVNNNASSQEPEENSSCSNTFYSLIS